MNGYIFLWKKFAETSFYKNSVAVHLAIHCLLHANFKTTKTSIKYKEIVIERGQLLTGLHTLSINTGISLQSVRTGLKFLENIEFLTRKVTNKFSIITITKYEDYQNIQTVQQANQQTTNKLLTSKQQATNKLPTTYEEVNEVNELNEVNEVNNNTSTVRSRFDELWKAYPIAGRKGKQKAEIEFKKLGLDHLGFDSMIQALNNQIAHKATCERERKFCPEFLHLERWIKNRRWDDEIESETQRYEDPAEAKKRQDEYVQKRLAERDAKNKQLTGGI